MSTASEAAMMAAYNQWMNARLYEAAAKLPVAELTRERGAFFGSILGTLNHLAVGDTIWLKRFAAHPSNPGALDPVRSLPQPTALNQVLFTDLADLKARRDLLDQAIIGWAVALTDADLAHVLEYTNSKGIRGHKRLASLVTHFFNHQTHHRGQVTTLFSQAGIDVGVTDLLSLIPNEP
jgi:uncharacterized damage-inducible protein DinB